jgi:uncharacterized protein YhbP (UPF0306 family)
MNQPEERILGFIKEHHVLTLAISRDNVPWCASCYYAYLEEQNQFIFTSDHDTRHIRDVVEGDNFRVAGTIALETKIVGKIRGIQFSGIMKALEGNDLEKAKARYLRRFPIARLMPGLSLWSVIPDVIKMTDNRLGFGKKLIWTAEEIQKPSSGGQ